MHKWTIVSTGLLLAACGVGGSIGRSDGFQRGDAGKSDGGLFFDLSGLGGDAGDGGFVDECSEQAKLVYVVDTNNKLSSFAPDKLTFTDIGTLKCPAESGATPFSMAIDRNATAWVLYSSGELFKVDTSNAACVSTNYQSGQQNFKLFGMGFATDGPNTTTETLFIGGGLTVGGATSLGTLSTSTFQVTKISGLNGSPELTGTGEGKLYGFFPATFNARVDELNKGTAQSIKSYPLSALTGDPRAWAFAFWGGDFWIFLKRSIDDSTVVWRLVLSTGSVTEAIPDTNRNIVGAGVSTCAPIVIG